MGAEEMYIGFREVQDSRRRTKTFTVFNLRGGWNLGEIKWNSGWRQYCFFPEKDTVFSSGCMLDINEKIAELMSERKNSTSEGAR